jgi:hypothetical protein
MSDFELPPLPQAPVSNDQPVRSLKEFSDTLTLDLTDQEIKQAFEIIYRSIQEWQGIFRAKLDPHSTTQVKDVEEALSWVDRWEGRLQEQLAEINIAASVDIIPVLEGTGHPTIVIEGATEDHYSAKYGMDHEKKGYEVKKAKERDEAFLGAKLLDINR